MDILMGSGRDGPPQQSAPSGAGLYVRFRLKKAQTELRQAKSQADKSHLVEGATPTSRDPGLLQDEEMLDEAARIQGKDKSAVRRMQKMVAQTEDVASSTMDTMKNQTEQLSKIHAELEEMDSTLKLADQQIKQYVRKMATDKLIMAMLFLIVIGIIVVLVRFHSILIRFNSTLFRHQFDINSI